MLEFLYLFIFLFSYYCYGMKDGGDYWSNISGEWKVLRYFCDFSVFLDI